MPPWSDMATIEKYTPGQFCWVDFVAHDMKAASKFYCELFGWTAVEQDTQGGPPYTMFQKDGKSVAGIGQMNDPMIAQGLPPMWNSYVSVADAAAVEDKAQSLGASITVGAMDAAGAGRMMYFDDPLGAAIAVWQPQSHYGAQLLNEPGTLVWNELACRDLEAAKDFYGDLFGWAFNDVDAPVPRCVATNEGQKTATLLEMDEQWGDAPTHWMVYFAVADTDAEAKRAVELGAEIAGAPRDTPQGRFAVLQDPQGGVFSIVKPNFEE